MPKSWKSCLLAAIAPWDSTKESETAVVFVCLLHTLEESSNGSNAVIIRP